MEVTRTAWAAAVEIVLAGTIAEVIRTEVPTVDRISPNARKRNDYARGTNVSYSIALTFNRQSLTAYDAVSDVMLVSPVRKAVEAFKLNQAGDALRTVLLESYWDARDSDGVDSPASVVMSVL